MLDLSWKAGHVAVAEAGDLAGPRGWPRACGTVKDKWDIILVEAECIDMALRAGRFCSFLCLIYMFLYICYRLYCLHSFLLTWECNSVS